MILKNLYEIKLKIRLLMFISDNKLTSGKTR